MREDGSYEKAAYVVNAESKEDVEAKLKWHIDLSQFDEFSIKSIKRIKPFYRLWSRIESPAEYIERKRVVLVDLEDDKPEKEESVEIAHVFAIGMTGFMRAFSEAHAFRRLAHYFFNRASSIGCENPLFPGGQIVVEAQGEADDTNTNSADRIGAVNLDGRAFRGGLPSLGARR